MSETVSIEQFIREGGQLVYAVQGTSMLPLLHPGRDLVYVSKADVSSLKRFDVILFRSEDHYVLHRIIRITDHGFVTAGDHNDYTEEVNDSDVVGVMTGLVRDGKKTEITSAGYQICCRGINAVRPFRKAFRRLKRAVSKVIR